jgi:glycine/D-amino acid oxidase-like deaminating enzyme
MRIALLPRDDNGCGWLKLLPEPPPARRLVGEVTADWVVVGAGFAGLAAARRLGELQPKARVVLLEAQRVGQGSSGRNSGFVISLPYNRDASPQGDIEFDRRVAGLNRFAIAWLEELIGRHAIACDWARTGRYHGIVTPRGDGALAAYRAILERLGEPHEMLEGSALAARLGASHYRAAVHTPDCVLMQPAALVRGLASTLPANVELYEESPIVDVRHGPPHRLATPAGVISADNVILATNGFTAGWGRLDRHLIPLMTFASLTRPMTEREAATVPGEKNWGLTPACSGGTTMRRTADGRILVRNTMRYAGGYATSPGELRRVRRLHEASLRARFPSLAQLPFEHSWGGMICLSRNNAPYWGRIAPGVFASAVQNGIGVAKGTYGGRLLAEYAVGGDSPLIQDMLAFARPAPHGLGPLLGLAVGARLAWAQFVNRAER